MPINKNGCELPSDQSLVAVCDIRPVSMSDRIQRYLRAPRLMDDLMFDPDDYDPDDDVFHDDDDRMMSPHEDRFQEYKKRRQEQLDAKLKEESRLLKEKMDKETEDFRNRVLAVQNSIPRTE